jgi:hypothetical protein
LPKKKENAISFNCVSSEFQIKNKTCASKIFVVTAIFRNAYTPACPAACTDACDEWLENVPIGMT